MNYDKPFVPLDDLIIKLKERGLKISDDNYAKNILRSYSYYDLINGYKNIFMPNNTFNPNTTIEFLRDIYILGKEIQSLCIKYSLIIETKFKNTIAEVISSKFGVHQDDYLDTRHFKDNKKNNNKSNNKRNNNLSIESVKIEILRATIPKTAQQPTKHYIEKHNHIPPWILFKNISLGATINLFNLLLKDDKKDVVDLLIPNDSITFSEKVNFISVSLDAIRRFRNSGAHNLNFVNCKVKYPLPLPVLKKLLPDCLFNNPNGYEYLSDKDSITGIYGIILCFLILITDIDLKIKLIHEFKSILYFPYGPYDNVIRQILHGPYKALARIPYNTSDRLSYYKDTLK